MVKLQEMTKKLGSRKRALDWASMMKAGEQGKLEEMTKEKES